MGLLYEKTTEKIIGAAYAVHRELGAGFLEKAYQNAMRIELAQQGLKVETERPVKVYYKGIEIGDYVADMVVEDKVIVEFKAVKNLNESHEVQLVNYLKATEMKVGLLMNFGEKVEYRRRIFDECRTNISANPRISASEKKENF